MSFFCRYCMTTYSVPDGCLLYLVCHFVLEKNTKYIYKERDWIKTNKQQVSPWFVECYRFTILSGHLWGLFSIHRKSPVFPSPKHTQTHTSVFNTKLLLICLPIYMSLSCIKVLSCLWPYLLCKNVAVCIQTIDSAPVLYLVCFY